MHFSENEKTDTDFKVRERARVLKPHVSLDKKEKKEYGVNHS